VFLVNSRLALVSAALSSFGSKSLHQKRPPFFRSYGGNLPSSLTRVISIALVFSTCPPESVWGTGTQSTSLEAFLGSMGSVTSPETARHHLSGLMAGGFAYRPPYGFTPGQPTPGMTYPPASPHRYPPPGGSVRPEGQPLSNPILGWARTWWYRNINLLCIDYALRPRLSSRLTLGG
jgi:hypothetical protein